MIDSILYALNLPLRQFYFKGPSFGGLGGWEGMLPEDICAQLTHVSATMWRSKETMYNCLTLLENKYQAFCISVHLFCYVLMITKFLQYVWFRYFILGPILAKVEVLSNVNHSVLNKSVK
jgi:hypothetical protein